MRSVSGIAICIILNLASAIPALAETALARAYAEAWQRQPAAAALAERQRAAQARRGIAEAWTAAPPSLELGTRSDRFNRDLGAREHELGLVLPLWLPGERSGSLALAEAEGALAAGRADTLRLELAQILRDAWWSWQAARNESALAGERIAAAQRLRDDVARRFAAGDLSRADLNQAEGVLALAKAQQAESEAALAQSAYLLESLTGSTVTAVDVLPEPEPASLPEAHPRLREWQARSEVAQRDADLARVQTRGNPELAVSTRRDRAAAGDADAQTWALALRIPLASAPRRDARVATANAEAIEASTGLLREQERLVRETQAAQRQVDAARAQYRAADERARLARETRSFYEKSFRLGESDLPTRLRIESEAFEAERALGRAAIAQARSLSQWRQSLGLLPE